MNRIYWPMAFFLAGWFAAVIGFEISPMAGSVAAFVFFATLAITKRLGELRSAR